MFKSVIVLMHVRSAGWAKRFAEDIAAAFNAIGFEAHYFPLSPENQGELEQLYRRLQSENRPPFLLDVNGKIDTGNLPKFSLVVDHPLAHPHLAHVGINTALGCIDANHAGILCYTNAPISFVPHGGPEPLPASDWNRRHMDILFIGHVDPPREITSPLEQVAQTAGIRTAELGGDPFDHLCPALAEAGAPMERLRRADFANLLSLCSNHAQMLQRMAVLGSFRSGTGLHVVGHMPGDVAATLPPGTTVHGSTDDFDDLVAMMGRAKVVVNLSCKFPHGAHERVFYGMSAGCAIVTSRSGFLAETFLHDRHIAYYDHPAEAGPLAESIVAEDRAQAMAQAALPLYLAGHTWEERAYRVLAAMTAIP
ncbi:MAG: glycosyltransferase [Magnetospirillum sp.]|nr:glycosyltransferase [Magnetospirillum sp.]